LGKEYRSLSSSLCNFLHSRYLIPLRPKNSPQHPLPNISLLRLHSRLLPFFAAKLTSLQHNESLHFSKTCTPKPKGCDTSPLPASHLFDSPGLHKKQQECDIWKQSRVVVSKQDGRIFKTLLSNWNYPTNMNVIYTRRHKSKYLNRTSLLAQTNYIWNLQSSSLNATGPP
jgi:hypothetical protein